VARIIDQYRIIGRSAGWLETSARGRIRFDGRDAVSFLQALVSNDVERLQPGEGLYATYLTSHGRMVTDLEVYRRSDGLLCVVAPGRGAELAARFDQLIFSEDVRVTDRTAALSEITVVGADAARLVGEATATDPFRLSSLEELAQIDIDGGFVLRAGEARLPMYRIVVETTVRDSAIERLEGAGCVRISPDLIESLRVEAGRPAWGRELTEDVIPLEAGLLDRAISTDKGCYVGQEIVIRILHRGHGRVAKRLVTLAFDAVVGQPPPSAGATLTTPEGTEIGRLTSVAQAPDGSRYLALGYLVRDKAEPETRVVVAGTSATAIVTGFGH
jgi:folate-binding protein YgfZ